MAAQVSQQRHPMLAQVDYARARSPVPLKIEQMKNGSTRSRLSDRFFVSVPCCLDQLKWEILYNMQYPTLPPDLIFGAEDADFQPLVPSDDEAAPSKGAWSILRDWKVKDPSRLLRLILELRNLYLRHQRQRVEALDDPQVRFEISTIGGMEGLEMRYVPNTDKPDEVVMCFPLLKVDLRQFPRRPGMAAESSISLQVRYTVHGASSAPPQIKLLAPMELKELYDVDELRLPGWPERTCLMIYYPQVQEMLKVQVREAFESVVLRRTFMEALAPVFGRPLEAETTFFRKVTLLSASGVFAFLVHMQLPVSFPKQQPAISFQSSQHFDSRGRPLISRQYTDYPWSPRWNAAEMAQRICDFVAEECLAFKKQCADTLMQVQR